MKEMGESDALARTGLCLSTGGILYLSLYRPHRTVFCGHRRKRIFCSEYRQSVTPISYLETGVLHCGDNLDLLGQFPSECIDLVYLDPPFFSNRQYEVIWGDEAEVR